MHEETQLRLTFKDPQLQPHELFYPLLPDETDYTQIIFLWAAGNYACDCVLGKFVYGRRIPCGNTITLLEIKDLTNNKILYQNNEK